VLLENIILEEQQGVEHLDKLLRTQERAATAQERPGAKVG
jgi:hypothetical protein